MNVTASYDGHGRLTAYAQGSTSLAHGYNGLDDRTSTTSGGVTTRFLYDPSGRIIGEYGTSATDVRAEHIWLNPEAGEDGLHGGGDGTGGYTPIAMAQAPTGGTASLHWVHSNHLGVPLLTTDATGTASTPTGHTALGFPGQTRTLADLWYNRYRDYDPTTGRYIQADPIGLEGGSNSYAYALGNPLKNIDPEGLNPAAFFRGAVAAGELISEGAWFLCQRNPAACMATIGGAAVWFNATVNRAWGDANKGNKFCPPVLLRGSGDSGRYGGGIGANPPRNDTGSKCDKEWEDAYKICDTEYNGGRPNPRMTGGTFDRLKCARGFVSRRCGGNRPDYEHDPRKPKSMRPKNWSKGDG